MIMVRFSYLLVLCALVAVSIAAAPSFCKCTCFTNSTIIALSDTKSNPSSGSKNNGNSKANNNNNNLQGIDSDADSKTSPNTNALTARAQSATCALCNRKFCLSYNLPICKGAEEKDVFTTCFQRDSAKDQAIVILFIGTTLGLLGWAGVQKFLEGRTEKKGAGQGQYARVGGR